MKAVAGGSPRLAKLLLAVAVILLAAGAIDLLWAQAGPFGVPRPQSAPPPPTSGMLGWIFAKLSSQAWRQSLHRRDQTARWNAARSRVARRSGWSNAAYVTVQLQAAERPLVCLGAGSAS
jgi:hypothetical protein